MNCFRSTSGGSPKTLCRSGLWSLMSALTLMVFALAMGGGGADASAEQGAAAHAGEYRNPVLFADYSDPDVIRDGEDFYLVASSFHFVPGIPILHSKDLVHWEISGHVVPRLAMNPAYDMVGGTRYAGGVWAPSVRFHNGLFYIYFPTPDEGIFVSTAPKMTGPWSAPQAVLSGHGYEDPCPFWDDNGDAYLVHSKLGAGPLILHRMSADGKRLLDDGKVIVQDPVNLPTLEGPKFYKRHGWYYIFAPMGGVGKGSQVVLRSRNINGPYEHRIVLAQGKTSVNGPHQGAWVEGADGRGWFVHFQQRGAHGRIVWLEPLRWENDWPAVGEPTTGVGTGEPVEAYALPAHVDAAADYNPKTSDDFSSQTLSPMWEWNHNPDDSRWSLSERPGYLRLHPGLADGLFHARNTLTETMQNESLEVVAHLDVTHLADGDRAGLSAFDRSLSGAGVSRQKETLSFFFTLAGHEIGGPPVPESSRATVQLRVRIHENMAAYSYSLDDGRSFHALGHPVALIFSWWKGARPAVFAFNTQAASSGYVDFDAVDYSPLAEGSSLDAQNRQVDP
jgi:beta-xylosidase